MTDTPDVLRIGDFEVSSRLFVGTGKYATYELMRDALAESGCQVVTVAVRRERMSDESGRSILDFLDLDRYTLLPNTAGCFNAEDAVRTALLGRELLEGIENPGAAWVKLEVLGDKKTLLPDPVATVEATGKLVAEGFQVLVYTSDDPVVARRLKEAGATSVMPAGSRKNRIAIQRENSPLLMNKIEGGKRPTRLGDIGHAGYRASKSCQSRLGPAMSADVILRIVMPGQRIAQMPQGGKSHKQANRDVSAGAR